MKLYDQVKYLLESNPIFRNSDRYLIWKIWRLEGSVSEGIDTLNFASFKIASNPESIRRCRQKVQEHFPYLQATKEIKEGRQKLSEQKGQHML